MKLSEYKGEKALDVLADLIEPASVIMADKEVTELARSKKPVVQIVKPILKKHKKEVIEILAALDGEDPKTYVKKVGIFTLPAKFIEIFNDPELMSLFTLQGQNTEKTNSGSATENTKADKQ